MDKIKKLNLKKQLFSLKFCYEEQLLESRALISKVHNLENLFKITKQFIKIKKSDNFNLDKEKRKLLIISQKNNLLKNIDKQSRTLLKSILYNRYEELQKQKESLIQMNEEKANILKSIKNELNFNKIYNPYYRPMTQMYLNDTLDTKFIKNFNNIINNNIKINNANFNNEIEDDLKKKFNKIIIKQKIKLQKKCEEIFDNMKRKYNISKYNYLKMIEDKGYNSYISNKKYNKTFIFTMQPLKNDINNSSNDSYSESNDDNIKINIDSNSMNDHCFFQEKEDKNKVNYNNRRGLSSNKNDENNKNKIKHNLSTFRNDSSFYNKQFIVKGVFDPGCKYEYDKININVSSNFGKNKDSGVLFTEINNDRNGELNKMLLNIKEKYYRCLDKRYELKNTLKTNISHIYNIKEKIKKNKKEINIKALVSSA